MQRLLVVGQVTISVVLLTGAGLLGRSLLGLFDVDPGFDADGVVVAALTLPSNAYPEREDLQAFTDRLSERLRADSEISIDFGGLCALTGMERIIA